MKEIFQKLQFIMYVNVTKVTTYSTRKILASKPTNQINAIAI